MIEKCAICDTEKPGFTWCDQHGIGACSCCGMPYTIYHYEGEGDQRKRVDKPPSVAIYEEWVPVGRRYWEETKRRVFPGVFDMGFFGRAGNRGETYSGATQDDMDAFDQWMKAHKDELPKPREQAEQAA